MKRVIKTTDASTTLSNQGTATDASTTLSSQVTKTAKQMREDMQPYFDANDKCEVLYVASDGVPFYELHFAENYQRGLDKNKEVVIINR